MPNDYPSAPGLDEARQGRPWWKMCCAGCFLLVVAIVAGSAFLWHGAGGGKGPQELSSLPPNFPPALTLYRAESASSIEYFSGQGKQQAFSVVVSPIRYFFSGGNENATSSLTQALDARSSAVAKTDTVVVTWKNLASTRDEVIQFYQDEFSRNGFRIQAATEAATKTDTIVAARTDISVVLKIQDLADIEGVDTITATVEYPHE